jgi:NADPH:quinone reductase-like Zn-dependent oxidoreductase
MAKGGELMKAIVYRKNGPPEILHLEEVEKPVPGEHEVLIKVCAAAVNPLDCHLLKGGPAPLRILMGGSKLKRPGVDAAGIVECVGPGVTSFKAGDAVFGLCHGAFAEYAVAAESKVAAKPAAVSFEDAAAAPVAALTALQGLRDKGKIQPGQNVLINGASGGVGTFAVQLARIFGAHVTAVCSGANEELVRSLGAEQVIDYTKQDFARFAARYDLIFDLAGNHSFSACKRVLSPRGIVVGGGILDGPKSLVVMFGGLLLILMRSQFSKQKFTTFVAKANRRDLDLIGDFMATGTLRAVIDRRYKLSDVAEAVRYQGTWRARGKLVAWVGAE